MSYMIYAIVIAVFIIRLFFLKISIKNEKKILKDGGREYGVENSKRITILHILFYLFCLIYFVLSRRLLENQNLIKSVLLVCF